MPKIDWFYCRGGWQSCNKTREFLAKHKIETIAEVDARKDILREKEARDLFASANKLYVVRGKKVVSFDLKKETPDKEAFEKMILGRTGNLRAPTIRKGKKIIIGFNEDSFREFFGIK